MKSSKEKLEYNRIYYWANLEEMREKKKKAAKKYYWKNIEGSRKYHREWKRKAMSDPEKRKQIMERQAISNKKWQLKNQDKIREYKKKYMLKWRAKKKLKMKGLVDRLENVMKEKNLLRNIDFNDSYRDMYEGRRVYRICQSPEEVQA